MSLEVRRVMGTASADLRIVCIVSTGKKEQTVEYYLRSTSADIEPIPLSSSSNRAWVIAMVIRLLDDLSNKGAHYEAIIQKALAEVTNGQVGPHDSPDAEKH